MPWYSSKPVSGRWGWHWTMDRFNPDKIGANGRRELASHYRPLIGPYDSSDPDALEYQVLLMKFAGISGVIIDWYGIENFLDYGIIHRNSLALLKYIRQADNKVVTAQLNHASKLLFASRTGEAKTLLMQLWTQKQ